MKVYFLFFAALCSSCAIVTTNVSSKTPDPDTVVDFYHGDRVSDPYRWLEERTASKAEEWIENQNSKYKSYFTTNELTERVRAGLIELEKQLSPRYSNPAWAKNRLFALKTSPPKNQPFIVAMPSWEHPEKEEVLVDPNIVDPTGQLAVDWFVPSPDGNQIAVSMSKNDSEFGDLYIYNLYKAPKKKGKKSTAEQVLQPGSEPYPRNSNVIRNVHRALGGGSLVWTPDSKGFYYTQYPGDDEEDGVVNQKIYYHELKDSSERDRQELGNGFDRTDRISLEAELRSGRVIATVQRGESQRFAHFLRTPEGDWQQLSDFNDKIVEIVFASAGGMFVITREDSKRGKVLFWSSPKISIAQAKRIIPETNDTIISGVFGKHSMLVTQTRLYIPYLTASGNYELRVFSHDGKQDDTISISNSAVGDLKLLMEREEVLLSVTSLNGFDSWYRYNGQLGKGSLVKTGLSTVGIDTSDINVTRVEATASDGAKLPLALIYKGTLVQNANTPTLLIGAQGFGRIPVPNFTTFHKMWIDNGGIIASASVRGGGEFGEAWHVAGRLTHKKKSIYDFYACAKYLIDQKYTGKSKLAVRGKEHSATVTAAMLVKHPGAFGAIVAESGIFDMMRHEYTPAGEASVEEFGKNSEEDQYRAMIAYSPYHQIPQKTAFPPVLFIAGSNDRKIVSWHSMKMAARLQAENSGSSPVLIKSLPTAGNGKNIPYMQRLEESAEILAFLFKNLGVKN